MHAKLVWAPRRRRGASPSACRGVLVDGRLDGMGEGKVSERAGRAHSSGEGVSGAAKQQAQRWRGSSTVSGRACTLKCLRAQSRGGRERGEREREWREKERVKGLTQIKLKIFN